jgi:hypothetical protein
MNGVVFRGGTAGALERSLLGVLRDDQARVRGDLAQLARPFRIVVASGSLRAHLSLRLAREAGAWLGVRIQTLAGVAHEILERRGVRTAGREDLYPIRVRRCARDEPALRDALDDLSDGYGVVGAAVDDLLDAGFGAEHAAALDEALAERGVARESPERALVRVAARVAAAIESGEVGHRSRTLVLARETLERDASEALPSRGLAVYGFADATGVQADLLAALLRSEGAGVWLALPPDPARGAAQASEPVFGADFRARVGSGASSTHVLDETAPAQVEIWRARDPHEEARAVADALRRRLDAGAVPERLAVVARDLEPYRLALRRHLAALGVPFSGARELGPLVAAGRRLAALVDLLREGERLAAERWLEALARLASGNELTLEQRWDLQHALHQTGCATLREVAELAPRLLRLDVPHGLRADASGRATVAMRELSEARVAALVAAAQALLQRLDAWPARASLAEHAAELRSLVASLGWCDETVGHAELDAVLDDAQAPDALERAEWLEWLARALADVGRAPLGGEGGGVQVLSVMEARGLDFDHVFVLGLCRGSFPRPIREDALLPDRLRRRLRALLPDLPIKRDGFDEERFLFAQLLGAAPALTLSVPSWDVEGKPQAPSPLLDALLRGARAVAIEPAPAALRATPRERAGDAGLRATREAFAGALRVALASAGADEPGTLACARLAALAELDPRDGRRSEAGPLLGFAGSAGAGDPRAGAVSVTALEALASCPWKSFLERVLRLKPPRDARGALPSGVDQRLLGAVVHAALARIAGVHAGAFPELDALRAASPAPLAWPDADALSALLLDAARDVAAEEAIALPSYARALAQRARLFVEEARRADWMPEAPQVLGGEVNGILALDDAQGARREVRFRADRVDRAGNALRLTDYKTGRPPAGEARDPQAHAGKALEALARGALLQTAVYALAAGDGAQGRYVFLRPDLAEGARVLPTPPHADLAPRLHAALRTLLAGWDGGAFVPRLREPSDDREPFLCSRCELKDACLRGDSGVRQRLGAWAGAARSTDAERAALALWQLPEASP